MSYLELAQTTSGKWMLSTFYTQSYEFVNQNNRFRKQ